MTAMGNHASSKNVINTTMTAYTSVANDTVNTAVQNLRCDNKIEICDIKVARDFKIDGFAQNCRIKALNVGVFKTMQKNDATTNISSAVSAAAQAASSGLPMGNKSKSSNRINSSMTVATSLKNRVINNCSQTADVKNDMSVCGVEAGRDGTIQNLVQEGQLEALSECTTDSLQDNTSLADLSQAISATSSATAEGLDLMELFRLGIALMALMVVGATIAWIAFTRNKKSMDLLDNQTSYVYAISVLIFGAVMAITAISTILFFYPSQRDKILGKMDASGEDEDEQMYFVFGARRETFIKTCTKYDTKKASSLDEALETYRSIRSKSPGMYTAFLFDLDAQEMLLIKQDQAKTDQTGKCKFSSLNGMKAEGKTHEPSDHYTLTNCMCGNYMIKMTAQNIPNNDKGEPKYDYVPSPNDWHAQNPNVDPSLQYACGLTFTMEDSDLVRKHIKNKTCPVKNVVDSKGNPLIDEEGYILTYAQLEGDKENRPVQIVDGKETPVNIKDVPVENMKMVRAIDANGEEIKATSSWRQGIKTVGGALGNPNSWSTVMVVDLTKQVSQRNDWESRKKIIIGASIAQGVVALIGIGIGIYLWPSKNSRVLGETPPTDTQSSTPAPASTTSTETPAAPASTTPTQTPAAPASTTTNATDNSTGS